MWILVLIFLLFSITPSIAEQHFSKQYARDVIIFNLANASAPDNPLNPANRYNPTTPFAPLNRLR